MSGLEAYHIIKTEWDADHAFDLMSTLAGLGPMSGLVRNMCSVLFMYLTVNLYGITVHSPVPVTLYHVQI